ncbi:Atherin [Ilyodon furcidens]|uniref:Atherin n=1 Tax=Ilyodon furcidens TaxID=33524 RepID=A0ABV0V104_9TELE
MQLKVTRYLMKRYLFETLVLTLCVPSLSSSVKMEKMNHNLLQWTVADVASYFSAAGFPEQAVAFRTQEIDGKSLLLMQRSDVLTGLSIRLGPALKIYERHVKVLQRTHFLECEDI